MKATEMSAKWYPRIREAVLKGPNAFIRVKEECLRESVDDVFKTIVSRKVQRSSALRSVIQEHNAKFNKFARLLENQFGTEVFAADTLEIVLLNLYQSQMDVYDYWFPVEHAKARLKECPKLQDLYNRIRFIEEDKHDNA